jgi:glycosyltransferase involved in cell wall biosynthesis
MRKLFYLGLEPYEGRYTLQLQKWNEEVFKRRGIDYVVVPGLTLDNSRAIVTGQVLDAHGRSYFALSQMMNLVKLMREGQVTDEDVVYFEDMFQPGIEALPYILNQVEAKHRPKIWVRCLAQSIDPDDFVHVTGMAPWMRHYEALVNQFVDGVLCTNEEMVAHAKIAGWTAPLYNISGLAFGKKEVQSRVTWPLRFEARKKRVVFAARADQEKQPWFFCDLAARMKEEVPELEFAFLSGGPLRSNHQPALNQIRFFQKQGIVKVYENLSKDSYYSILNDSRVLFNCALQDWVSNTVSEADALGTNVVYPAYRSFPETFANDYTRLYVPWSIEDAETKVWAALEDPSPNQGKISDWNDGTIGRILDIMEGTDAEFWDRNSSTYRHEVSHENF